jgi:hypothetical protein
MVSTHPPCPPGGGHVDIENTESEPGRLDRWWTRSCPSRRDTAGRDGPRRPRGQRAKGAPHTAQDDRGHGCTYPREDAPNPRPGPTRTFWLVWAADNAFGTGTYVHVSARGGLCGRRRRDGGLSHGGSPDGESDLARPCDARPGPAAAASSSTRSSATTLLQRSAEDVRRLSFCTHGHSITSPTAFRS